MFIWSFNGQFERTFKDKRNSFTRSSVNAFSSDKNGVAHEWGTQQVFGQYSSAIFCVINLTLWPVNYSIWIFTHLKLCLADAIHNFKWVKIIQIWQNGGQLLSNIADWAHILSLACLKGGTYVLIKNKNPNICDTGGLILYATCLWGNWKEENDAEFDQSFYAALLTVSTILYFTDQYTTVPGKHRSFSMFRQRWYDVEPVSQTLVQF